MILILQNCSFSVKCVDELSSGHTSTTLYSWHTLSPWRTVRHLALPPGLPQYQAAASWWAQKQQSSGPLTLRPVKLVKVIDLGLVSRAQLAWCTTPPVWSRITAEPQSSLIQSALHIVSPSLCLSASTFEDGAYHRTPTHATTHTLFFFFLPWCDISPRGISSSSRPSAPHPPLLNPVYFGYTAIITHIHGQTHTVESKSYLSLVWYHPLL